MTFGFQKSNSVDRAEIERNFVADFTSTVIVLFITTDEFYWCYLSVNRVGALDVITWLRIMRFFT